MEPSPPQPPRKPKENRPFYAPPVDKPLSVQIINEARSSLKELKTKRPFTPRDEKRTLFGPRPLNTADNRPPSAFRYVFKATVDSLVATLVWLF